MNPLKSPYFRKMAAFAAADVLLTSISVIAAFWLRFDGIIPKEYWSRLPIYIGILVVLNLFFIWRQRLYAFMWSFVGLQDMARLLRALTYSSIAFALLLFLDFGTTDFFSGFPRSVIVISYILNLVLIGGIRISKRLSQEIINAKPSGEESGTPTVIIGAGTEGERLIRDLRGNGRHLIIGLLDDKAEKQRTMIHGIPVLGKIEHLPQLISDRGISHVIIALPNSDTETVKLAIRKAREAGVQNIKIIPPFSDLLEKKIEFEALKDVTIEDLLGRETAKIETKEINSLLKGKRVMVTGAAGSIGSELVRQIARFEPENIILLDFNESGIYDLEKEMAISDPKQKTVPIVASIVNKSKIEKIFGEIRPNVVFHAAAYKHVPLMEFYPEEAVHVNIFGTLTVAEAARKCGTEKFVMISTDKAVRPASVMGKTKRVAETIVKSLNDLDGTRYVSVRFGNVLASRGSVVPLFQEQIRRRAAVTVTHPDMMRYFMTIPEASLLVLEAGAVGNGGEIFLLDMGKPVKILDLAHELIRLSGLEPDKDIPIVFTGVRPGEKIFEELLTAEEGSASTNWEKLFISRNMSRLNYETVLAGLNRLENNLGDQEKLKQALDEFIALIQMPAAVSA